MTLAANLLRAATIFRRDDDDDDSGVLGDFLDENNASRTLAPAAVGSQFLLMSLISVRLGYYHRFCRSGAQKIDPGFAL